jgi:hypothetical protein
MTRDSRRAGFLLGASVVVAAGAMLAGCPGTVVETAAVGTTSGEGGTSVSSATTTSASASTSSGMGGVSAASTAGATSSSGTAGTSGPCDVCPATVELCLAPLAPIASLAPGTCKRALPEIHFSDPPTCGPLGTFSVGAGPEGIAFDGTNMWVANYGDDTVTKLSPTGATLGTYAVPGGNIAFDGCHMWAVNGSDGTTVTEL